MKKILFIDKSVAFVKQYDLKVWIFVGLLVGIGFFIAFLFVEPPPPNHLVIATGRAESEYYRFGKVYQTTLAEEDITLDVVQTRGSLENLQGLLDHDVDLALVQGGVTVSNAEESLQSLGSLYFEPLWIFYRNEEEIDDLRLFKGKKVAVGGEGSGNRKLAILLLGDNGLTSENTELLPLGGVEAIRALAAGEIDVFSLVTSPQSVLIRELFTMPDIRLMSFRRHKAYCSQYPFLSSVVLPEGAIDLEKNIPDQTTILLSPTANLVCRKDIHPAMIPLMLQVITQIHNRHSIFSKASYSFPSDQYTHLTLNKDAKRFIEWGPPFLLRYISFWTVSMLDRMKIFLLPLLTLLIPLGRLATPTYRWRIRSRIYRWYRLIRDVEYETKNQTNPEKIEKQMDRLRQIEDQIAKISVPLSYMNELYSLIFHISFVQGKLKKKLNKMI
ncbi:MAG: hypothetical protein B6244_09065 [Candidatus Cloacimonetes bacterium 4572_55]|nr:MAG: hypothetical protein B6244_09065 [Candidatus Cloacimonetes bacterium 4572_55]